ncbi:hypothetical protein CkaCkLH20_03146 [Colletotrichum karsti]|uniref:Uncharacterized protein n=1 Tax=Colletotrichum karsti TaxID=1095194 RepID=A0A9P6IB09_9PEZI|nr:uncharacterized protein CkaCkLH20_03146 [Colletotrichum karsti]KAF9879603.1 hypothetical protein CkaCkLH20_03146 [Colletotrichum karsti]
MPYSIEVELELVELLEDFVISLDFCVGTFYEVACSVELCHGEHLALFAEYLPNAANDVLSSSSKPWLEALLAARDELDPPPPVPWPSAA